jgi:hypothetical protein
MIIEKIDIPPTTKVGRFWLSHKECYKAQKAEMPTIACLTSPIPRGKISIFLLYLN